MDAPFNVEVEYRKPLKDGSVHMLKVHFHDLGMYIDGWTMRKSDRSPSGWWFQSPARPYGPKLIAMIEFAKGEFWQWLESEAIKAVETEIGTETIRSGRKGMDVVHEMPPDEVLNDEEALNQYISDSIDQTVLETGIEQSKPQRPDPWRTS